MEEYFQKLQKSIYLSKQCAYIFSTIVCTRSPVERYKTNLFKQSLVQKIKLILLIFFNTKGGRECPICQEIDCHFSQNYAIVTKNLDFIHKHLNYLEGRKVIFLTKWKVFQKYSRDPRYSIIYTQAETNKKIGFSGIENHKIDFFQLFGNKNVWFYFTYEWQFLWEFIWGI